MLIVIAGLTYTLYMFYQGILFLHNCPFYLISFRFDSNCDFVLAHVDTIFHDVIPCQACDNSARV